ncbi:11415_t:CDS:2 [Funneliformis geosporum]|uniref:11415_t:CDS:1 n=1 Tax=Funneliformis geosporum TaxID=1117311 RepID=A0A9W4SYN0_9GLOM|nr:11415_t:CDS:2 [Funneliformis geosporum]
METESGKFTVKAGKKGLEQVKDLEIYEKKEPKPTPLSKETHVVINGRWFVELEISHYYRTKPGRSTVNDEIIKENMTTKNNNLKKNKTGWREIDVSELERMRQPGYRRINQGLTPNATPLAKSKHEICKSILRYKREHNLSEKEIGQLLGIKQTDKLEYLLFCHIDYFTLDELVDYANLAHDQSAKIQQLTQQIQQLENNLAGANEVKTLYQQKASDLETSLLNLGKSKLAGKKEYLNQEEYNTKEKRERVKELKLFQEGLEGCLDLGEFANLTKFGCMDNFLDSIGFSKNVNLTSLDCYKNNLTFLDVSGCVNLTSLSCCKSNLTSIDFLNQLPNPEKLEVLEIYDNNIQPTTLDFLQPFVNLKDCKMGLNSVEPIKNLTKLEKFCIAGTDVEEGIEYIPIKLAQLSSQAVKEDKNTMEENLIDCQPLREDAKVKKIQDQLRPFNYDLEA